MTGCFLILSVSSCLEQFDASFEDFESALVIEATITDELKQQQIFLTRTYKFEDNGPVGEASADVSVKDSQGKSYVFEEEGNGLYRSSVAFSAEQGVGYQLFVNTKDGVSYSSEVVKLTSDTSTSQISAKRITNGNGVDGIAILVDSYDPTGTSRNYRYEYEETFKVIAPNWNSNSLEPVPGEGCEVVKVPNQTAKRVCYPTVRSSKIILTSTKNLTEDRVSGFLVRFINGNDYILSHRYSILVRQYVQSGEAFTFFKTLNEISSSESLFSQIQHGFLEGNVFSITDKNIRTLGFFEVAVVDEERFFLNYEDFYPNEPLPPYIEDCNFSAPPIASQRGCILKHILEGGTALYVGDNASQEGTEGPYLIAPRVCGDCSELGSSEVPVFWYD